MEHIPTATAGLRNRAVEITREPELIAHRPDHDPWMSFFHDSEGNTLALISEVRRDRGNRPAAGTSIERGR